MKACDEQDMAIMAIRVFAASYLATPVRTGRESILTENTTADKEARAAKAVFGVLGDEFGTWAQTAVRFALSNQMVSTTIVGLSDEAHLDEAAQGAEKGPLDSAAMKKLKQLYRAGFA